MASNSSSSPFQGFCPTIFLQEEFFGQGGYVDGRFCAPFAPGVRCCIPCPVSDWLYPDNFNSVTRAAQWINVISMVCSVFLLASFIFLPVSVTHRHYLNVALTISIIVMQLGFLIPLGANPKQCFDAITPNDMHSSIVCALSGSFLLLGGWASLMWVCVRSMALHLQICWQVVIGKTFMYGAYGFSWGLPAIGVAIALVLSGVSFRFGDTCHVNHQNSLQDIWIPMLVFSGVTLITQCCTFGYCIKVYLSSLNSKEPSSTTNSSALPSYTSSIRNSPRQAYRRVRRVIELQWRGICVVLVILTDVIFFAVVFVYMDSDEQAALNVKSSKALPWVECMVEGLGKQYCLKFTKAFVVNEATVTAVLILLSFNGIWALLLLGRFSIFPGWWALGKEKLRLNHSGGGGEFVSADANRSFGGRDTKSYEMISVPGHDIKEPEPIAITRTPSELTIDPIEPMSPLVIKTPPFSPIESNSPISPPQRAGRKTPDYFGQEARYVTPMRSFSAPRPPSAGGTRTPRSHSHVRFPGIDPLAMNKI